MEQKSPIPTHRLALGLAGLVIVIAVVCLFLGEIWFALGLGLVSTLFGSFAWHGRDQQRQIRQVGASQIAEITSLKSQLSQQERAVDALAEGLDNAIFVCDERAGILYANRRAKQFFRFENAEGRSILAVTLSHELEKMVLAAKDEQEPRSAELTFSYPDERIARAVAWPGSEGDRRVFMSLYEITDLRRLERVRQDFVANVSHELRTPLTIIRAMAETLLDDAKPKSKDYQYLEKIVAEVDRLSTISQDLLVLSVSESNIVRKQACDLADTFNQAVAQLQNKAASKSLILTYEGAENLLIEANPIQMTQVALNLVDNAINYTLQGTVVVRVERVGSEVQATVTDTGVGIAGEFQSRVFERFYRVDKARSRVTGGTGLGLSIVKHIVEAHGGTVAVESALNVGSAFSIRIPIGNPLSD